jgi:pectinesterase
MARPAWWLPAGLLLAGAPLSAQEPVLRVAAGNELDLARPGEMVELALSSLGPRLRAEDLARISVVDARSLRELLAQAVDADGDGAPDRLVFAADFAPRESRNFLLFLGERRPPRREDFRVRGRFVRERYDDFAWENDRVAHRMYGEALETWQREPLTSSAVDVWVKRTRRLVIDDWYLVDDYHRDHGEGADFYSAGPSRGCGGSGVWSEGRLFVSMNFRRTQVLANGPLRLVFELGYLPWDAPAGRKVSERKRVTLDAGTNLNRFESFYTAEGGGELTWAAGIKKAAGAEVRIAREQGIVRTWEPIRDANGHLGCAILVDPEALVEVVESAGNVLVVARSPAGSPARYWAGSAWDRSGDFPGVADWDRYLEEQARRRHSPLRLEVRP